MYNIGIDWEDKGYTARMVDDSGKETAGILRIKKNQEGFNKVLKWIRDKASRIEAVIIGIERDRDALVDFLLSLGYQLYLVDPNQIDSFLLFIIFEYNI